ncbi:hypothetical protein KUL25_11445 [Rhodobacteraceae bacterium N5(2021)]|nr:hypothetical protein [Gymnodinialimonas phycosphaerae]MBY4893378.1 hypothetical protein [Gymnodinialimonas phycosphaerae]
MRKHVQTSSAIGLSLIAATGVAAQENGVGSFTEPEVTMSTSLPGDVQISYSTGIRYDSIELDRAGAWNGPVAASNARAELQLLSAYVGATATFGSGTSLTLSYGRLFDLDGQNYGHTGQASTDFDDGEGNIIGLGIAAPLGDGFSVSADIRRFDLRATDFVHPRGNHDPCPTNTYDNCQFTQVFVTGDLLLNYTADLSSSAFYSLGAGVRLTNGYAQFEQWDDGGGADDTQNVSPQFSVDPILSAGLGYDLGGYEVSATAFLVGEDISLSIGVEMLNGASRSRADGTNGAFSVGTFVEYNQFAGDRILGYYAQENYEPSNIAEVSTAITSAGVFGQYSTAGTDIRIGLGSIVDGTGAFRGNSNGANSLREWEMSDASGYHINLAVSSDVMAYQGGMIRAAVEFDYTDITFGTLNRLSTSGGNWDDMLIQTLTAAAGASYHRDFASGVSGYAGLDYMISASNQIFRRLPDTGNNSNATPIWGDAYRVRLGGTYDFGNITASFEVSGNHIAGASAALGASMSF